MHERPILFSAPMVRAILAGTKSQTRRIVKPQAHADTNAIEWNSAERAFVPWRLGTYTENSGHRTGKPIRCPYGASGDRLWVRETWRPWEHGSGTDGVVFDADREFVPIKNTREAAERWVAVWANGERGDRWRPSIHMPRWASRITLEVTGVRVERLQAITEEDAKAEGARFTDYGQHESQLSADGGKTWGTYRQQRAGWSLVETTSHEQCLGSPQMAFANLWIAINGRESWDANPWVWVVAFRRIEAQERAA